MLVAKKMEKRLQNLFFLFYYIKCVPMCVFFHLNGMQDGFHVILESFLNAVKLDLVNCMMEVMVARRYLSINAFRALKAI